MQKNHYGHLALLFFSASIAAFLYTDAIARQQTPWHVIPLLLLFLCLSCAIVYVRPILTKTQYISSITTLGLGFGLYYLELFWGNMSLIILSFVALLMAILVSTYLFNVVKKY